MDAFSEPQPDAEDDVAAFGWDLLDEDHARSRAGRRTVLRLIAVVVVIAMLVALAIPVIVRIRRPEPPRTEPGVLTSPSAGWASIGAISAQIRVGSGLPGRLG